MVRCCSFQLRKSLFGCLVIFGIMAIWFLLVTSVAKKFVTYTNVTATHTIPPSITHIFSGNSSDVDRITDTVFDPDIVKHIQIFNASSESEETRGSVANHQCVRLRTPGQDSKICVHPRAQDRYVSGGVMDSGMWEWDLVQLTADFLASHPDMALLDLGCNIGVYSLYFARAGRKVVSVDASKENLLLLSRSLNLNNLQRKVTLVWNAMSDVRESVILKGYPENKGGTYVQPTNETDPTTTVKTALLDDLAPLFRNESVFIKMDIETYEWKALNGGWQFFKSVKVGYVLMEFSSHRNRETGKQICEFMSGFGFRPYGSTRGGKNPLNTSEHEKWPTNVLWSKF